MKFSQVAVIGIGSYFSGARNPKQLWENILSRRQQFRNIPEQRFPLSEYFDSDPTIPDKTYGKYAAVIDDFQFDWPSKRIPKTTYESTDLVHWLALEIAIQALTDAKLSEINIPKEKTGVIVGNSLTGEFMRSQSMRLRWPFVRKVLRATGIEQGLTTETLLTLEKEMEKVFKSVFAPITEDTLAGNLSKTVAGRICNFFDLHGGGYVVDGACSSSLLAVTTAADKLLHHDLDLAIAGGVDISIDPFEIVGFAKTKALAAEEMNVFDQFSSGFIPGEGSGFVVLKRLDDARRDGDYIYGVLRGWGVSSDGKGGITAPKIAGQALALQRTYEMAGYSPQELDFIECHGTGTAVGDRVELEAIATVMEHYGSVSPRSVGVTSFKSLVGHTKAAAGIGGLLKALLSVNQRVLVPTAGLHVPNRVFDSKAQSLYPILHGEVLAPDRMLRAGVSAMGFGGINCHLTIESGDLPKEELQPAIEPAKLLVSHQETELFIFAANTREALLDQIVQAVDDTVGMSIAELTDYAYQLATKPIAQESYRAAIIANHPVQLSARLTKLQQKLSADWTKGFFDDPINQIWVNDGKQKVNRVGFLFPGQGSQFINMGRKLVKRFDWAKQIADVAWSYLPEAEQIMFRHMERAYDTAQQSDWETKLSQTEFSQVAICLSSVLWYEYMLRLGVKPAVVAGHSLGELSALYAAGAYGLDTLFCLAKTRGAAMATSTTTGVMASLQCDEVATKRLLDQVQGYVIIANINSLKQTVISGEKSAVSQVVELAKQEHIIAHLLPVSHAFHSALMQVAAKQIKQLSDLSMKSTWDLPFVSGIDGIRRQDLDPVNQVDYLATQILSQVNFTAVLATLRDACDLLVEVGPGRVLTGLVRSDDGYPLTCFPVESKTGCEQDLQQLLASYFIHGGSINWEELYQHRLIRPFVPAKDKQFITNPCELPLIVAGQTVTKQPALTATPDVNFDTIQSDRDDLVKKGSRKLATTVEVEETIVREVATFTGFEQTDIKMNYRLLDDLNLDSIKSAELVSQLIRTLKITEPLDVTEFSNSSLEEIASKLNEFIGTPVTLQVLSEKNMTALIVEEAAKLTGFDQTDIKMDYRLLDDLNLDSIKSAEFINRLLTSLQINEHLDVTAYANASLLEIERDLVAVKTEKEHKLAIQPVAKPSAAKTEENWVRNFSLTYMETPRVERSISFSKKDCFLIVTNQLKNKLALELERKLAEFGVKSTTTTTFTKLKQTAFMQHEEFSHIVVILPKTDLRNDISSTIDRLQSIIQPGKAYGYRASITYIQYGGGKFGSDLNHVPLGVSPAKAFAASLHQERPSAKIRVIDLDKKLKPTEIVGGILMEIVADEPFIAVGFDKYKTRLIPYSVVQNPAIYPLREIDWSADDVIVVTGGAKGITAECMLGVAETIDAKLALVGSSSLESQSEVQRNMARFHELGVVCEYYQCDITQEHQVTELIAQIEAELGKVTGFVHGAANLQSKRAEQITKQAFLTEIAPKVIGATNMLQALAEQSLKLIVGFSSLAGVSGMAGNSSYGFSNEMLQLMMRNFGKLHSETETLVISFGLWDQVGMGAKGGVTQYLEKKGINPLPVVDGVKRFVHLFHHHPTTDHVIITSRMKDFPTWLPAPVQRKQEYLFIDEVTYEHSGIELIAKYQLDVAKDDFVREHRIDGTYVFPAVFGLEAMAQAVSFVTGIDDFSSVCVQDVVFSSPIIVHREQGTKIEIRALVLEDSKVQTEIRSEASGFQTTHFSAVFSFQSVEIVLPKVEFPTQALQIDLETDFYQPILFHGPLYHRLKSLHMATFEEENVVGETFYTVESDRMDEFLLGDPYFHDALIHSARFITPQHLLLPAEISLFIKKNIKQQKDVWRGVTQLIGKQGKYYIFLVSLLDEHDQVVQQISFKLYSMKYFPSLPSTDELVSLTSTNERRIKAALEPYSNAHPNLIMPEFGITALPQIHRNTKEVRRKQIQPLFRRVAKQLGLPVDATLAWSMTGKPSITQSTMGVSIAHDDDFTLCLIGKGEQGCDILPIEPKNEQDWLAIYPFQAAELLHALQVQGEDSVDVAGSRVWACFEATKKASQQLIDRIEVIEQLANIVEFRAYTKSCSYRVITSLVQLTSGLPRMIAFVISEENMLMPVERPEKDNIYGYFDQTKGFVYRFPLIFEDSSTISRRVNFSSYAKWMGKVREILAADIVEKVKQQLTTGIWGMATNFNQTEVFGEAKSDDVIEAHFRMELKDHSYVEYVCHWHKVLENGELELIASTQQGMTWVEVIGHGEIKKREYPTYMTKFFRDHWIDSPQVVAKKSIVLSPDMFGDLLYQRKENPSNRAILQQHVFETSLEESNLVGNVYFANYNIWQGSLRDKYFHQLTPEFYTGIGESGEWIPIRNRVQHLREAMPFDRILVEMSLMAKYEHGVKLFFEYYKLEEDGAKRKLAYGEQDVTWMKRDKFGFPHPALIPEKIRNDLDRIACV